MDFKFSNLFLEIYKEEKYVSYNETALKATKTGVCSSSISFFVSVVAPGILRRRS